MPVARANCLAIPERFQTGWPDPFGGPLPARADARPLRAPRLRRRWCPRQARRASGGRRPAVRHRDAPEVGGDQREIEHSHDREDAGLAELRVGGDAGDDRTDHRSRRPDEQHAGHDGGDLARLGAVGRMAGGDRIEGQRPGAPERGQQRPSPRTTHGRRVRKSATQATKRDEPRAQRPPGGGRCDRRSGPPAIA